MEERKLANCFNVKERRKGDRNNCRRGIGKKHGGRKKGESNTKGAKEMKKVYFFRHL
jgi:hypothetical protein